MALPVFHGLLISSLRLQRLSLVDVLVLVWLLKGNRALLLLLFEDVLCARPRTSVDHVSPILSCVTRKLLPPATIQSSDKYSSCIREELTS